MVSWQVKRLPVARREWGEAVRAELAAVPPGDSRLRWAVGSLWFLLRRPGQADPAGSTWSRTIRGAAIGVGIVTVLPWLAVSILGLRETDAPDAPAATYVSLLVAQSAVIVAFLLNWRRWWVGPPLLVLAVLAYGVTAAVAAVVDNPALAVLAALPFAAPPAVPALVLLFPGPLERLGDDPRRS